jgi:hypothetical protein
MPEENNPAEEQEKTPQGDQPAEGGDKKPDEKKVEETGTKPSDDPDKKKKEGDGDDEMVQISKKELKNLKGKHNSRGAKNRVSKKAKRSEDRGGSRFSFEEPVAPDTSEEEIDYQDKNEFVKLKSGVADLILDNENILKAVKADPTLKRILKNNPLALLDTVPIDAEDALEQISDYLDGIVSSSSEEDGDDKGDKKKDKKETNPAPQQPLEKDKKGKDEKISTAQGLQKVEDGLSKRFEEAGL